MSSIQQASMSERRNRSSLEIDRLATADMLALIHQQDKYVTEAITPCLAEIGRLVDNVNATAHRGGRVMLIGAGESGRLARQAAEAFAQDRLHPLCSLVTEDSAAEYGCGLAALRNRQFNANDMLVALSVSGKTPWICGAMYHAWSLGARVALISRFSDSEASKLADIVIAPQTGAEVISGPAEPKARLAQQQILTMVTTSLAIRSGRVYSNLRVDIQATNTHWAERQIAIVMAATGSSREQAKRALALSSDGNCRTAILMLLTSLNAEEARELLTENSDNLRIALCEAKRVF
ncbi:N-acetylmuramic acid 6-phosphate etherase [Salmonella enterica]